MNVVSRGERDEERMRERKLKEIRKGEEKR